MIGICRPLAQLPADLDAVAVGQHEVDDRRVAAGAPRRGRAPPSAVAAGIDLEAGLAQDDPQRAQDLRLVVADEDALLALMRPRQSCRHRLVAPQELGRELDDEGRALARAATRPDTCPPLASTKPRTIASPRPEPRWPALALPAR